MKRLVYRPKVWAYVKAGGSQPIDLSPYLVRGRVDRVVNDASTARLTLLNPDFKFTENQTFKPMDPITIFMARDIERPVRVFTGFLDDVPYLQLFPGTIELKASCTIKRLMHTYWDPALPFSAYFLNKYGWQQQPDGSMKNIADENKRLLANPVGNEIKAVGQLNDSGLTSVLAGTMQAVGHWDAKDLLIEPLPSTLTDNIEKLYNSYRNERKDTQDAIRKFLKKFIGDPPKEVAGGSGGQTDASSPSGQTANVPKLPDTAPDKVKQVLADCDAMASAKTAYLWGGNHDPNPAKLDTAANKYMVDCSGFVSWVLAKNGLLQGETLDSNGFASWGKSGEGQYFTVWTNSGHVFIEWKGTDGKSCIGTTGGDSDHSVRWHPHTTSGFTPRHWEGM